MSGAEDSQDEESSYEDDPDWPRSFEENVEAGQNDGDDDDCLNSSSDKLDDSRNTIRCVLIDFSLIKKVTNIKNHPPIHSIFR